MPTSYLSPCSKIGPEYTIPVILVHLPEVGMLQIGDVAPDCLLQRPDGSPARLADFDAPALVLVFLRHLA